MPKGNPAGYMTNGAGKKSGVMTPIKDAMTRKAKRPTTRSRSRR